MLSMIVTSVVTHYLNFGIILLSAVLFLLLFLYTLQIHVGTLPSRQEGWIIVQELWFTIERLFCLTLSIAFLVWITVKYVWWSGVLYVLYEEGGINAVIDAV